MACTSRSRKTVGYGNVRKALSAILRSWPVTRMSTNAASTPSAEVPDIRPMTYMGQEPSRPLATNQGNCAPEVPSFVLPAGLVYNLPAFQATTLRSERERATSYGTRIHRPRQDGQEQGHTPPARQAPCGRLRPGDGTHPTGGKGGLRRSPPARGQRRQFA